MRPHSFGSYHSNSGRGGGIRTPIPGFGDRSPNRWTTPLKTNPALVTSPRNKQKLFHFLMRSVLAARIAKLLGLQAIGVLLFVFCRCVIAVFTIAALQRNDFPHESIL